VGLDLRERVAVDRRGVLMIGRSGFWATCLAVMLGGVLASSAVAGPADPGGSGRALLVGRDFRISAGTGAITQEYPAVAHNSVNNQYLVVWGDTRKGENIYGRRVAADGTRVGRDFRISSGADIWAPAIAYNSVNNQYLVVWRDYRSNRGRGWDIFGRRVKANGDRLGSDFRISGGAGTSEVGSPVVVYNPANNQYLVVWHDYRNQGERGTDIYGRRVKANGDRLGGDFRISGPDATADNWSPAVAYNSAANQYLVVWHDERNQAERGTDIYGQRLAADGTRVGADRRISGGAPSYGEYDPAVSYNSAGNQYLVVWRDQRKMAWPNDVYGQRVRANGTRVGGNFRISSMSGTTPEGRPTVVYNAGRNRYLVVWHDLRNQATSGLDLFGQQVKAGGILAGVNFRISGKNATADEWRQTVAYNSTDNQYLAVWSDSRNWATRNWDVYGRRVNG